MDDIPVFDPIFRTQSPVHSLLSQRSAKHGRHSASTNLTPPVIHLHDTLPVSQALFADAPRTHYNMPCSEIHRTWPSHAATHASIASCTIQQATKKNFARGGAAPNIQHIYTTLKPAGAPATSTLQHPTGHCQSHFAEVLDKQADLDFGPGSI